MHQRAMDRVLVVSVLLWSSALQRGDGEIFIEHRMLTGPNGCSVTLEVSYNHNVDLNYTQTLCRGRDCGSVVRTSSDLWRNQPTCYGSDDIWKVCDSKERTRLTATNDLDIICSDSVRLLDGTSLCSGRLEVKSAQSDQRWSSVCEADFDQQDAEVVCGELGCGAPSVLQGALYGEVEAPTWTKEFQCGGNESALLDCRSSGSTRNTCSPGKAVGLTCSEPVRLVGGDSRCAGKLEVKHLGEWRPVFGYHGPEIFLYSDWTLKAAAGVCRDLDCGSAVSIEWIKESSDRSMWWIKPDCVQSGSALKDCVTPAYGSFYPLNLTCSDLLVQPNISVSSMDVSKDQQVTRGCNFTISCSIQPQYPGGSFQLTFTSSTSAHNYTQPAVNHSAHFLFPAADPAHTGSYSCVYHVYVSSHKFSSESRLLTLSVSELLVEEVSPRGFPPVYIFTVVLLVLTLTLCITGIYFSCKANRGQTSQTQMDAELSTVDRRTPESDGMKGAEK